MSNEPEKMWKETVVIQFEVATLNFKYRLHIELSVTFNLVQKLTVFRLPVLPYVGFVLEVARLLSCFVVVVVVVVVVCLCLYNCGLPNNTISSFIY